MAASKPGASAAASTADREIYAKRVFDAPRELVWKVWTSRSTLVNGGDQSDLERRHRGWK